MHTHKYDMSLKTKFQFVDGFCDAKWQEDPHSEVHVLGHVDMPHLAYKLTAGTWKPPKYSMHGIFE